MHDDYDATQCGWGRVEKLGENVDETDYQDIVPAGNHEREPVRKDQEDCHECDDDGESSENESQEACLERSSRKPSNCAKNYGER